MPPHKNLSNIPVYTYDKKGNPFDNGQQWLDLNQKINGNSDFYPLTIKAGYVVGTVISNFKSIGWLSRYPDGEGSGKEATYFARLLLILPCIELLGRCVTGCSNPTKSTLKDGLKWMHPNKPATLDENDNWIIETNDKEEVTCFGREHLPAERDSLPSLTYTFDELYQMRNFVAHGQATTVDIKDIEKFTHPNENLLYCLNSGVARMFSEYWDILSNQDHGHCRTLSENLAKALIDPIDSERILIAWLEFQRGSSIQSILRRALKGNPSLTPPMR